MDGPRQTVQVLVPLCTLALPAAVVPPGRAPASISEALRRPGGQAAS